MDPFKQIVLGLIVSFAIVPHVRAATYITKRAGETTFIVYQCGEPNPPVFCRATELTAWQYARLELKMIGMALRTDARYQFMFLFPRQTIALKMRTIARVRESLRELRGSSVGGMVTIPTDAPGEAQISRIIDRLLGRPLNPVPRPH